ncbi:L-threonine 3-dehydrogenase [Facilibium subflavum]|uniref:L-threonine 3-dehydrogenase n=1 Tax=Facilibium subflavum TaxID=2219058 RepID=UPI000E6492BA|nr:L-threonine 3-dehydrogenase [Facilibium subflavum]
MKALSKLKAEPGIWMTELDLPQVGHNDVLIKVKKTAICGTDLHIYLWDQWSQQTIPVPMAVGHEFVGEIVETGCEVKGFKPGDRVSGEGHITCGFCRNCRAGRRHLCRNTVGVGVNRQGAFAEYLSIPAENVFKVPDYVSDDIASIFDPFGNAVHTALSFNLIGEDVLITGAGPIGIMAVAIARHVGAKHIMITDVNDYRLNLAKQMGADIALNVKDCPDAKAQSALIQANMKKLGMEEGFDVGMEMSGNPTAIADMIKTMNNGGSIAMLGIANGNISVDWNNIVFKGLHLKGIYGREIYETWYKMASMVGSGLDVSPVITHHFDIDDYLKGFELMKTGQCGKVILNWV